jgi:hypothetical protein
MKYLLFAVELLLSAAELQVVFVVYTRKTGGAAVDVVAAVTKIKVEDVDRYDFYQTRKWFSFLLMLCDRTGRAVEHSLKIVELSLVLNFYDDDLAGPVFYLEVNPVEFVSLAFLVAFAFQYFEDNEVFTQKFTQKTFEYLKVGFAAQKAFHGPVKGDQFSVRHGFVLSALINSGTLVQMQIIKSVTGDYKSVTGDKLRVTSHHKSVTGDE